MNIVTQFDIKHIPMSKSRYPRIFLVTQNKVGFLINCDTDGSFGYMCPCCFFPEERRLIMNAVSAALAEGLIEGKVRWCCHKGDADYGDRIDSHYPLEQKYFCSGSANADIDPVLKSLVHEEAVRVSR